MHLRRVLIVAAAVAILAALVPQATASKAAQRQRLAEQAIGINMAFYEGQRAGRQAKDSPGLFPELWKWKKPGYENACAEVVESLPENQRAGVDFPEKAGYFEAGNAVIVTAASGFVAAQHAIGALQFMPQLGKMKPGVAFGDPGGCVKGGYTTNSLKDLLIRQIRYMAASLSNTILLTTADNSNFKMLVGISDSSTYNDDFPSWGTPPSYQQKCYVADMSNPAADVAAQAATGLAMTAKVLKTYGTAADSKAVQQYTLEAERAYAYAELMHESYGINGICFLSTAVRNCIGSGCTLFEPDGDPTRSTCDLYRNQKPAPEFLFTAAAALYALTGNVGYHRDADSWWPTGPQSVEQQTFLYNWNNALTQGIVILSMEPDVPGANRNRDFYRRFLRTSVELWSKCSNEGKAIINYYTFCQRTPDGSAYPLDTPWGNLGTTLNGVCAAGIYQMLGFDPPSTPLRRSSACFMQRQLGYIFNHKCNTKGSFCNTNGPDGFSYMVGMGRYYPTKLHSRDSAYPFFYDSSQVDTGTLCGGIVSGPYENPADMDGPVRMGTDLYTNDRRAWRASEAAIDYSASLVCGLMSYALMPDTLFEGCPARSPFTGRGV